MEIAKSNDLEKVGHDGDIQREHRALWESAGVLDLSARGRLCVAGADRTRFLHGQVTNDVKALRVGQGCYAALITAKGKMQSDLNIYNLADELLLDFEPGLTAKVAERLEKYVIADDVQIINIASNYGLLSIQGPQAESVLRTLQIGGDLPGKPFEIFQKTTTNFGELYVINQPRLGTAGFDLLVASVEVERIKTQLIASAEAVGGCRCGLEAFELARIEAGIPRYGADMDETINPLEAGLEMRAISFNKGCYIGQEVVSRIHTYSEAAKSLRGLMLADDLNHLPAKGDKLFHDGKEAGFVTSAAASFRLNANIALAYVKREVNQVGNNLVLRTGDKESAAQIVPLPFAKS